MDQLQRYTEGGFGLETDPHGEWVKAAEAEAVIKHLQDELETANRAIQTVYDTFSRDEADGYRSRDRQFAIDMLVKVLGRPAGRV